MPKPPFSVFIPSKGRADLKTSTWTLLMADKIHVNVVVEPHEVKAYTEALADHWRRLCPKRKREFTVHALPKSNQGVSYARNHILAKLVPRDGWFWIMDDDITAFHRAANGKAARVTAAEMFAEVWRRMQLAKAVQQIAIFSLDYQQFAWNYNDSNVIVNSYCNIAVCMNMERLPKNIRYRFRVREDYDFVLQVIKSGRCVLRFRNLAFSVPSMGSRDGGMRPYYENELRDIRLQNKLFLEAWGHVAEERVKGTESAGTSRFDVKVRWGALSDPAAATALLNSREFKGFSVDPLSTTLGQKPTARDKAAVSIAPAAVPRVATASVGAKRGRPPTTPRGPDAAAEVQARPRQPKPPPAPARNPERREGWCGWTEAKYRVVSTALADSVGLTRIVKPEIGAKVVFIPLGPGKPPLLSGTVVGVVREPKKRPNVNREFEEATPDESFSVSVIPDTRGEGMWHGTWCFAPPDDFVAVHGRLKEAFNSDDAVLDGTSSA